MQKTVSSAKRETRLAKQGIKRTYLLICLGVMLVFSGYSSTLVLQSSLNIVGGLGSKATAVGYVFSVFFSLFAVPICLRLLGPKKSLIASEWAYIFYVLVNMYPREWSLIIAAIVVGWGEAMFWVPLGLLFIHYGQKYQKYSKKSVAVCVREFSGILFGIHILNQVFGNIFVFIFLYFLNSPTPNTSPANMTTTNFTTAISPATYKVPANPYAHCGANDCQDGEKTLENIDQYVPTNRIAVYALLATFAVIMTLGTLIHIFFLPDFPLHADCKAKAASELDPDVEDKLHSDAKKRENSDKIVDGETTAELKLDEKQIGAKTIMALKDILKQAKDWKQILIYPANFYEGLIIGFLFSEASRAYASCIKGVSQVGISSIIAAFSCSVGSYIGGRAMGKFGVRPVTGFAVLLDLFMFALCLLWIPTEDTSWIVYVIFAWLGVAQALWNLLVSNLYADSFDDKHELCFTMWCCWFSIGFAIQYGWSTALCVREKIYIQIPILILGAACIFVLKHKLKQKKNMAV